VYKALRGRQLRGLLAAAAGAGLGLLIFGAREVSAYGATFLLAVPGFAYGYFQPEGKPVEYWLLVLIRYHFTVQRLGPCSAPAWWQRPAWGLRVLRRAKRLKKNEEVLRLG
jgi:hypothetical protein